ncbi:DUF396-domain-containing protein [Nadsonia fulvescens var. elongata DSM 6958]|uniref:DUF396-domain-containing protein n=1 Tax=Nadsonia fulvescens var. elongata DSM 6958 TaxID=857566 RepID=A0A1E3PEW0_9ASCO|nr:DUF396-domain-containing protein [Nadsonia fulvescens var. elongata DSM 6958]
MVVLRLISWLGIGAGFLALTLAIACGLYYLSELVEEYSVLTKKILARAILSIILVHVLLVVFDGFPFWISVYSIACQLVYIANMKRFPLITFSDPKFLLAIAATVLNHYLWFSFFSSLTSRRSFGFNQPNVSAPPFTQIASFFGICIWAVPFALFISLSAGDMILPSSQESKINAFGESTDESSRVRKRSAALAKVLITRVWKFITGLSRKLGWELDRNHGRIV